MKLSITTKDKIKNPQKGFGFAFIDAEDNKLKIKKHDSIIEFSNDQSGSSCKFYECSEVIEQSEGGVLVSGITNTGSFDIDEVNGFYKYGELADCVALTGYAHEKGKMWLYYLPDHAHWVLTHTKQCTHPTEAFAYCQGDASENPWELAHDWTWNVGYEPQAIIEQVPNANASWSGYEWSIKGISYEKSSTITEGLPWTTVRPEIGKTYTEDALVEIASLYQSKDNGGTQQPEEPEQPVEPEQPESSFGTYLQISGSAAENESLDGVYKLNESSSTDIYKEWININDDTKKVVGNFVDIDPATYWTVYGGSDNYSTIKWESSMSYPWNADNSSFDWYYHAEDADFHVTPYVSDEQLVEPEQPEEPEAEQTKEILVASGFDETGCLSGTDDEYKLLDVSATGTAREWHCSTNNMRIVWYSSGSYWCIAGKDNMYFEVYTDENVTDPWDTTWYFMGNAISGATVTKKA